MFPEISTLIVSFLTLTKVSTERPELRKAQPKSGFLPGDFIIGALFPIHRKPLEGHDYTCGNIQQYGIQRVETAFYAIDLINK